MMRFPLALILFTLTPIVASAGPILRASAYAEFGPTNCSESRTAVTGTAAAGCDVTVFWTDPTNPDAGGFAFQSADATAAFGSLSASTFHFFDANSVEIPHWTLAIATADFTDELTVTGGTGAGFLQYRFGGEINNVADDPAAVSGFQFSHAGSPLDGILTGMAGSMFEPESFSYTSALMPFVFGTPFELFVSAQGRVGFFGLTIGSATVTLEGIDVFNSQGQLVNARILSAANAPFATPIPEPSTLLLVGAGFVEAHRRRLNVPR